MILSSGPRTGLPCHRAGSELCFSIRDSTGLTQLVLGTWPGKAQVYLFRTCKEAFLLPFLCRPCSPPQSNSGNSLVCQMNNTWIQMGVVSWSFSCKQRHFPGVYTSTSYFTDWMKKQIGDVRFVSRAGPACLSPVFLTSSILLISVGCLWLL